MVYKECGLCKQNKKVLKVFTAVLHKTATFYFFVRGTFGIDEILPHCHFGYLMGFVVNKKTLKQLSFQVFRFSPVSFVPLILHTFLLLPSTLYNLSS